MWEAARGPRRRDAHEGIVQHLRGPWSESLRDVGVAHAPGAARRPAGRHDAGVADAVEADLIVVGSRGVGDTPLGELGSTSGKIVRRSSRPVLVVPEDFPL